MAEEIPTAVVTFVAVLMFLQFGASETEAAIYSGLLFTPWVIKSFIRSSVCRYGRFKQQIHFVHTLMFAVLMGIALYLNYCSVKTIGLFAFMFLLSLLCAWHRLLTRMYYSQMLHPRQQKILESTKMLSSQFTLILTYGVLIIVAGFFEVFFRSYHKAWAMESYLVAGVFFLLLVVSPKSLTRPPFKGKDCQQDEVSSVEGKGRERLWGVSCFALLLLLLPQGLMFNSRVFFLLAPITSGGLGCSMQDIGFAQGTVGVIAFTVGLVLGKALVHRYGQQRIFEPMVLSITLSPMFYMFMANHPLPNNIVALCCMTFMAQLFFGFGLNVCLAFVQHVSRQQYENYFNYLYIPLVAAAMLVPMMASGWMVSTFGYRLFFVIATACAPLAWAALSIMKIKTILYNDK